MTDVAHPPESHRIVFAPMLRAARILWRILPMIGWSLAALVAAWVFGADANATQQVMLVAGAFLTYGLAAALIREALSPDRPWLRIVPVSDLRAHRLDIALRAVLFFVLLSQVAIHLSEINEWNPLIGDVTRVLRNLVITMSVFIIIGTTGFFQWLRDLEGDTFFPVVGRFLAKVAFPIALVTALVFAAVRGFGYYPLAEWVVRNAAWTTLKILAAVLLYRWLKRVFFQMIRFYTVEEDEDGSGEVELSRTGTYALGVVRILLGIIALALVIVTFLWTLRTWSLSGPALLEGLDVTIPGAGDLTWSHLFLGLLRVAATFWAGWFIRSILTYFVFPRSDVGIGGRYAILAVLRYAVVALAIVFALSAFGVDMSSLSWFFGAAGIGLAFGLQDIIGNFVSGLIMLVERPIRVGDVVQVGTSTGTVEEIKMRGTTLRTFDNTTLLIPNSQMLGERVTNLTHGLGYARLKIPVIAPHDVDTDQMQEILLAAARANEDILADPAPFVWLSDFSPSSLDFTLVCFTGKTRGRFGVASKVRLAINEALHEAGIDIPKPKQELYVMGDPRIDWGGPTGRSDG